MSLLPDLRTLRHGMTAALKDGNSNGSRARHQVTILDRRLPKVTSFAANEVITWSLPKGRPRRVFIKYESPHAHDSFGHRGNIAYEAEVYRRVLHAYPGFHPHCLGATTDSATGRTWLFLEYQDRATRVSDIQVRIATRQPAAMEQAARWLGHFHAAHEDATGNGRLKFLIRYDAEYFRGWARRALEFTASMQQRHPWLPELCRRTDEWVRLLLGATPTVIHGEFYGKNVLLCRQRIRVVDWESSALAAGEIDLAALTEGRWPVRTVRRCERAYLRARWPGGVPGEFRSRLDAAKIYLHFRWLGERPDWALREKSLWRYDHLYAAATRLGLIQPGLSLARKFEIRVPGSGRIAEVCGDGWLGVVRKLH